MCQLIEVSTVLPIGADLLYIKRVKGAHDATHCRTGLQDS